MNSQQTNNALNIAKAGGVVIVALAVKNAIENAFGSNDRDDFVDTPSLDQAPTIHKQQAIVIAEEVAAAIYDSSTLLADPWFTGSWVEDEGRIVAAMTSDAIRNDADVLAVADAYGTRGRLLTPSLTLFQAIRYYVEPSDVQTILAAYRRRGIHLSF